MKRCAHCRGRGVYRDEDDRTVCILCSTIVHEAEPDMLTKMMSNATPDTAEDRTHHTDRVAPDLAAIKARVMARIRAEAVS